MEGKDQFLRIFPAGIRKILAALPVDFGHVQEIRLRVQAPLLMVYQNREYYVTPKSGLSLSQVESYVVKQDELREAMEYISNHSLYAFEEEIRQGFLTIQGGHRIGIAGKTVLDGNGIKTIKYISFLNIRLAHEIKGCADKVMPFLYKKGEVQHTLLISPPKCGKTTLLRDIIRQFSDGFGDMKGITVGVVDERSEIGACYQGVPQNDLGIRTDVLDCCPKAKGMMMLIRTMSPQVIAVDEIGSREDLEAMEYVMNCGCKLVATVHGSSVEDIKQKPVLKKMMEENIFERYIILGHEREVGRVEGIYDSKGNQLYREGDFAGEIVQR